MTKAFLTLSIYGDLYAIPVARVLEVLEKQEITKVPNAPKVIRGILDFRGNAISLYETRTKFNLPPRAADDDFFIVVINMVTDNDSYHVGIIVDQVNEVLSIEDDLVKSVPPMSKEYNAEYLEGIARTNDKFILIINIDKIFESTEVKAIKLITKRMDVKN